jgi:DNA invertase Pin-like site-specific DNA recombinase
MMPPSPSRKRLIGYARVSTEDQAHDAQVDELRAAGCAEIHQEHGSGASRARPVLARLIREIKPGEVLVVVRLDRLARSVSHLLEVIEALEAKKAHFRSLRDPIDTSTPQGMFSLQVLGAVAQLERSLISERTRAGIKAAKARGKKPGNPGMRERQPEAIRKIALAREKVYVDDLIAGAIDGCRWFGACALITLGRMLSRTRRQRASVDRGPAAARRRQAHLTAHGGPCPPPPCPAQEPGGPAHDADRRYRHG